MKALYEIPGYVEGYVCHFCRHEIPIDASAEDHFDVCGPPEYATWAAGHLHFDDLVEGYESVCAACAERFAGPDWLEKGRAAIAQSDAWLEAVRNALSGAPIPPGYEQFFH